MRRREKWTAPVEKGRGAQRGREESGGHKLVGRLEEGEFGRYGLCYD